jgi:hypothetical protein
MKMTKQDEQLLSRYLDGELPAPEALHLQNRLDAEPRLQLSFERMQDLNETLKSTFNTPAARTVPTRVIRMLTRSGVPSAEKQISATNVVAFSGRQRKASWGFAIAASIMAASGLLFVQGTGQQLAAPPSALDVQLAQALETSPSKAEGWDVLADGRQVRPVLSYARIGGGWCREYLLSAQGEHSHGIACKRDQGTWITETLDIQAQQAASPNEYRTAGAGDSDQISNFIESSAADIALSAQKEQQLISTGWR